MTFFLKINLLLTSIYLCAWFLAWGLEVSVGLIVFYCCTLLWLALHFYFTFMLVLGYFMFVLSIFSRLIKCICLLDYLYFYDFDVAFEQKMQIFLLFSQYGIVYNNYVICSFNSPFFSRVIVILLPFSFKVRSFGY